LKSASRISISIDFNTLINKKSSPFELQALVRDPKFFTLPVGSGPKTQSKIIDKILGYRIAKIEQKHLKQYRAFYRPPSHDDKDNKDNSKKHYEGTQTWVGLHPQVLQTPYSEILTFLQILRRYEPKSIVDLGAAYGRIGLVMNSILPNATFTGFEIMDNRVNEARRMWDLLGLTNCSIIKQNILAEEFELPAADIYFIYDFSDMLDVRQMLKKLSKKLYNDRFFIIARGDGIRSLMQLKFPEFWAAHGAIHYHDWSIYSSFCDLS